MPVRIAQPDSTSPVLPSAAELSSPRVETPSDVSAWPDLPSEDVLVERDIADIGLDVPMKSLIKKLFGGRANR
jgi:hypothetical protein